VVPWGIGGIGAEEDEGAAAHPELPVRLRAQGRDLRLRHALAQGLEHRAMGPHRDLVRPAHQGQLVRVLDDAAAGGDGRRTDQAR
jgi:hypothetical protein